METSYSTEQEAFRTTLRRFFQEQADTTFTRQQWQSETGTTAAIWQAMADLGITSLLVPEDAGGVQGTMADIGIVMEELGRVVHPGPCWASCVGATSAAAVFKLEHLLGELAAGRRRATLAIEEPGRSFTTWQHAALEVSDSCLSGEKIEVPDAFSADYFFVTTAAGVYGVERDAQGLTLERTECIDGSRRFAALHFDDVSGTYLGDNSALAPVVDRMLVALCADGLGAAQRALEMAVAYASERKQFGQHIGSFQAVQHLCADMLQQIELGRAGLHYALWALDAAQPHEAHRAAVMSKAYMADTFPAIGANAIQIFGGAGFTWEYDIQLFYKRLLSLQLTWGGAEVWLEELATLVVDA